MVVRITAAKDQDIFRSEAAQGSLLQSARLISPTEACKGRSGPGSVLIGSVRLNLYAGSLTFKSSGFINMSDGGGSQRAVLGEVLDKLHDRRNPGLCWLSIGSQT